jgi:hypothetical protein
MLKSRTVSFLLKCAFLAIGFAAASACDFYEAEINDDWSLCAVDDPDAVRLCRNLGDDHYRYVLEPVMVAWGFNGTYISLKRCFEGVETFYSIDSTHTAHFSDPPYDGPLSRSEWQQAMLDDPELWPVIDEVWIGLERRHCPEEE